MKERVSIVGSGLDALIAAHELSKAKVPVKWTSPSNRVGGHFAGWRGQCGTLTDIGMVALEEDVRDSYPQPISEYSGQVHAAARPFLGAVFDALRHMGLDTIPIELAVLNGREEVRDYFISDDLSSIATLLHDPRLEVGSAAHLLDRLSQPAASALESELRIKATSDFLARQGSLIEVLRRTWGNEVCNFLFGEFLQEIDPDGVAAARDHRLLWAPLYWPSSIAVELTGSSSLSTLPFLGNDSGSVADFVGALLDDVRNRDTVTFSVDSNLSPVLDSSGETDHLRVDLRPEPAPPVRKGTIRIVHFCASHHTNKTHFLRSPEAGCFRINWRSGRTSESVSLEFGSSAAEYSDEVCLERAKSLLRGLGITPGCSGSVISGRVPLALARSGTERLEFAPLSSRFGKNAGLNFNEAALRGLSTAGSALERLGKG